ncbi:Egl nine [Plakobranchus ocellatus]|uniref:hypoxia-inducible factor-proline dioxygenase n=1 Tax=Plakobranchus ocellatus TaxID=259542 RepID=A0AAV4CM94_9GAST|nr:Egl nine [Plakobranchus ocellatus]
MATMDQNIDGSANNVLSIMCAVCNSFTPLKRCSRCKVVFYCSREHQKADWIHHKTECKTRTARSVEDSRCPATETHPERLNTYAESTQSVLDSNREEIKNILDFSTIVSPVKRKPQTKEEEKEIFFDLIKSESDYTGPSEDIDASYGNIIETLCIDNSNPNNMCEDDVLESAIDNTQVEEVPLFDMHPFRRLKFPKPESYNLSEIAEFVSLRLTQLGYCILDNAFEEDLIDGIFSEMKSLHDNNEFSRGDTLQISSGPAYRNDMIKWLNQNKRSCEQIFQSLAFIDSLVDMLKPHVRNYCDIEGRTKAMLACYQKDGSYFRRHIDNESKDGRCLTCTLYVNRDWDIERDGGLMRMFPPKQDKPVDVPPQANRLLFFWSDERTPHEIHPSYRDRYSITVWFYDKQEKEAAKVEKLKRETEDIYNQIKTLEEQRRHLQQMASSQQIRNRAMEAVQALSTGELQALSLLIDHHPDPKQALTSMGISDAIQDALIIHLSSQDNHTN